MNVFCSINFYVLLIWRMNFSAKPHLIPSTFSSFLMHRRHSALSTLQNWTQGVLSNVYNCIERIQSHVLSEHHIIGNLQSWLKKWETISTETRVSVVSIIPSATLCIEKFGPRDVWSTWNIFVADEFTEMHMRALGGISVRHATQMVATGISSLSISHA